jgi:hypothetical protein
MGESLNGFLDEVGSLRVSIRPIKDPFNIQFIGITAQTTVAILAFFILESFSIRLPLTRWHIGSMVTSIEVKQGQK